LAQRWLRAGAGDASAATLVALTPVEEGETSVVDAEMELIGRVRTGDKDAYAELLRPLLGMASRLAYGLLQDRGAAEDSVWDAATKGWLKMANLEPGRSFRPWFLKIVTNCCRETRRGRWWLSMRPTGDVFDIADPAAGGGVDEWLAGADLRCALAALPHGQRTAIVLHFYLDLPLEEVSATLGLTLAGTKSRINRGLRRLRLVLRGQQVVIP